MRRGLSLSPAHSWRFTGRLQASRRQTQMTQKPDGLKIKAPRNAHFQPFLCHLHKKLCVPLATLEGEKDQQAGKDPRLTANKGSHPPVGHTSEVPNRFGQPPLQLTTPIHSGLPVKAGINTFTWYPQQHPSIGDYSKCPDAHGATGVCRVAKAKAFRSATKNQKQLSPAICFLLETCSDSPVPVEHVSLGEKRFPWIWTPLRDRRKTTTHPQSLITDLLHRPEEIPPYPSTPEGREEKPAGSFSRGLAGQSGYSPLPGAFT